MYSYKVSKELSDLHLNYEQTMGIDDAYPALETMPMFVHRACGVDVNGDMNICLNNLLDERKPIILCS